MWCKCVFISRYAPGQNPVCEFVAIYMTVYRRKGGVLVVLFGRIVGVAMA